MHIYFSGIGGVAIGPLAEIALDAGYDVSGSDASESLMTDQLHARGIAIAIGQDGSQITAVHEAKPIDWVVYTAALPDDHPELVFASEQGIRTSKRDELLAEIIATKNLKLIAISGTHGKTTTTGLLVWALQQLNVPVSYSVGTTLSYGPSGYFDERSEYFVYECDEFDRNMLHFEPYLTLITSLDYDHADTYENPQVYKNAFATFMQQSRHNLLWEKDLHYLAQQPHADLEAYDDLQPLKHLTLAGVHMRQNAYLVERALTKITPDVSHDQIVEVLNSFPGTARRFEKLADNLYSDYGHHPVEIAATLQMAREISGQVVLVYQPHQNVRQHEVRHEYTTCMELANEVYWLPTYLSREDPALEVLSPEQLSANLINRDAVHFADLNAELWKEILAARENGKLVLCMGAGSIDGWVRQQLATK